MITTPSYYAIIPADVRYAEIPPNAKLLFGEITALTSKEGYCWATNEYFANLYGVSSRNVQRWLTALEEGNFIKIDDRDSKLRQIYLTINLDKNVQVASASTRTKKSGKPGQKSPNDAVTPIYNNTANNKHHFDAFWKLYPKKVEKKKAEAKWNRLNKTDQEAILADLPRRSKTEQWQKGYVPNPTTYLNGERWNDEIKEVIQSSGPSMRNFTEERLQEEAKKNPEGLKKLEALKQHHKL